MSLAMLLALAGLPRAQSQEIVVPSRFQSAEGETFTSFPFGRSTSVRAQHWLAPAAFSQAVTITGIAFRPDAAKAFAAKSVDLEIACATGPSRLDAVTSAFQPNRGSDLTTCFTRKTVRLPAVASAAGPRPFLASFPLDRSFGFDPAKGGLLVEVVVYAQQPGTFDLDLGVRCTSARGSFGKPGCPGSNGRVPRADSPTVAVLWGSPFLMRVRDCPRNAAVGLLVGTRESGAWSGLTLPWSLDGIGAPGCALNTDIALVIGALADANGEVRQPGLVPALGGLTGVWFRFQAVVLDAAANPLGLTLSNGSKTEICGPDAVARLIATNLVASGGTLESGLIPVIRLTVQ